MSDSRQALKNLSPQKKPKISKTTVAAQTDEIPRGGRKVVEIDGNEIALFNVDGVFYAIANKCPHGGFLLGNGLLEGDCIICPGHKWRFSLRTGECVSFHYETAAVCYPVVIEGKEIKITV